MADPLEDLLQKGAAILEARGETPEVEKEPSLQPFVNKLSFDQFLDFGQQRIEGADDATALRNVFGKDRTILGEPGRGLRRGPGPGLPAPWSRR